MTEDRLWQAISEGLIGRRQKPAQTGFVNICCPLCVTRGETADHKFRCGIINTGWSTGVSCFNCGFRARFEIGGLISRNMRAFLKALGIEPLEISRVALWAEQERRHGVRPDGQPVAGTIAPDYPTIDLPKGAQSLQTWADLGCADPHFLAVVQYLLSRGDEATSAMTYYWTDTYPQHLIIPCYYQHRCVGWIGRATTGTSRYHKTLPSNFLFNMQCLDHPKRKYVMIVEGVFDALVIDGIGALGASLNQQQITWINQCDKQIVVVPDRDRAGQRLIDIAVQQGWPVAIPNYGRHQWWDADVKDVADAVQRHGKLYTIQSILATLETDPKIIRMRASYSLK